MHDQDPIRNIQRIPVKDEDRIRTDFFCIVCNSIFVILLFIISIAVYNNSELIKMSLPNDSNGNLCGYGVTDRYTILYYPDIKDPLKRVCVDSCPTKNNKKVSCFKTDKISCQSLVPVQTNTEFEKSRIGLFCFPTDKSEKQIQLQTMGIAKRYGFMGVYDALWRSFLVSSIFAIIFVLLLQFFPLKVIPWTILIGGILSLIFGFTVMLISSGSILVRILYFIMTIGLAAACGFTLLKQERMRQIFVYARLMHISTVILRQNLLTILYIPIFIAFFLILLVICGFQILAAWSFSYFNFRENYPFYDLKGFGSSFLHFLVAIQFIWGMCFLKEAFNFCVSGVSTQWYFYGRNNKASIKFYKPFINLFKFHWGSVLGCALLTASFYVIDYILDLFLNSDTRSSKQQNGQAKQTMNYESLTQQKVYHQTRGCDDFLNLCRSQTMSYINLVSIPYCNAARYCQQLSSSTDFFEYSQSTTRTYRLAAHVLLVSIVTFISCVSVKSYSGQSDIFGILYISFVSVFTVTYFIGLHGDLADGLMISTFVEEGYSLDREKQKRVTIPQEIMKKLYSDDIKNKYSNKDVKDLLLNFNLDD